MSRPPDRRITNMDGDAALPRDNGELVFQAPWEGRAFGLAVVMNEAGRYSWRDFFQELVAKIAEAREAGAPTSYYEQWLAALETLAVGKGFLTTEELDRRTAEYQSGHRADHH